MKIFFRILILLTTICHSSYLISQQTYREKTDSVLLLISKAQKNGDVNALKKELSEIADYYQYDGDWTNYDKVISQMLAVAEEEDDLEYKAECYNKQGISNCCRGDNELALQYFEKALNVNIKLKDTISMANSYENIGLVYKDMALYGKALDNQLKSLSIREKIDYPRLINNYANISTIYKLLENHEKESEYMKKAFNKLKESKNPDPVNAAIVYNELAGFYGYKNERDSSIFCYKKVVELSKLAGWKRGIAVGLGNLAEEYSDNEEYRLAINLHKEVLVLSEEIDDCMSVVEELNYLSRLYNTINMLDSAFYFIQAALQKADACKLGKDKMNTLKLYSSIFEKKGDYKKSLEYYKEYHSLSDSLFNSEKHTIVADLEAKYQTAKKEQEIKQLSSENEIKTQRIRFSVAAIIAILFATGFIIFILIMRRRKAKAEQEKLRQQLFRSQMNPHFIFNALASIQNYLYTNQAKTAAGYLGNFSSLTRSILINSTKENISLEEEIEMLKNYIELEKMRMKNSFDYEILFDEDLETEFIRIPPMLIQPFVENAIKHGLKEIPEKGKLIISFVDQNDVLFVKITDNGIGIIKSQEKSEKGHKSMALEIFDQRMKIIQKASKKINKPMIKDLSESGNRGTSVELYLPVFN